MAGPIKHFSIYRFNPKQDKKPYMQAFELDVSTCKGEMLLDALEKLKEHDSSLAFRRSCGEGVCGSDGMSINGLNGLACITRLSDLPKKITLRPLPGLPVVRDLIVDMNQFYAHYESVEPYLQVKKEVIAPPKERLQTPEQRAKLEGLVECILCACCSSSCPSYWWNPDKFLGPAALLWAFRFIADSRDDQKRERLANLQGQYKVQRCRSIMNCVRVCPRGLNPTKAISEIRKEMLSEAA